MADVFISYSRADRDFVRRLHDSLLKLERDAWVDWEDIPPTAKWLSEVYAGIDAADNFVFVISPDSIRSVTCEKEITHAATNKKRLVPILHRYVPNDSVPAALAEINWIFFREVDDFDITFKVLTEIINTDLDWKRTHTRLLLRAREWEAKTRNDSFLLRGIDLHEALQWLAEASGVKKQEPSQLQRTYIKASQEWEAGELARAQRQATRFRRLSWTLGALLLLVIIGAVFAYCQRAVARARELVSASVLNQETDPEIAVLTAAVAAKATWPWVLPEAEAQLHQSLVMSHIRQSLVGHGNGVFSVAWSPNGKLLATGSIDRTAKVWSVETGKELLTLKGHRDSVCSVAWSPDSRRLATASIDQTVKVWDTQTGRALLTLTGYAEHVCSVAWESNGKRLASASGYSANVHDADTGELLRQIGDATHRIGTVSWSPDGTRIATGGFDPPIMVWDVESGKKLLSLAGRNSMTENVAWSPDGKRFASSVGKDAKVWEANTGKELLTLTGHAYRVSEVAWSPNGRQLATSSEDRTAKTWDAATGRELLSFPGHTDIIYSIAWCPDGKRLATSSLDKTARIWDAVGNEEILALTDGAKAVSSVTWSPDGKRLASGVLSSDDGGQRATIWDASSGESLFTFSTPLFSTSDVGQNVVAWSPNGKRLATEDGRMVSVIDTDRNSIALTLSGHKGNVVSIAWRPDGRHLATASSDKRVKVWDAETGKELLTLDHSDLVNSVAWNSDGKILATGSNDDLIRLWDPSDGHLIRALACAAAVDSVAWSPDGKRLAAAGADRAIYIWDAEAGRKTMTLTGHGNYVLGIMWSPDGKRLASGSWDHTARVWDAQTGDQLLTLTGQNETTSSVAWSPDGRYLAVGSWDGTVQIYAMTIRDLMVLAQRRVTIHPSEDRCRQYLHVNKCPSVPTWSLR